MSNQHKIVVVGTGGVGKSSLTIQFIYRSFVDEWNPTIEDSYRMQTTSTITSARSTSSTPLARRYTGRDLTSNSALRDQYMRSGEGFLCVYSIISRSSFNEINSFRDQIIRVKDSSGHSVGGDDSSVPMVLVGNKCDLESQRQVTSAEGADLAKAFRCEHVEVSAKHCINVEHSFFTLVREIHRRKNARDETETERLRRGRKRSILKPQVCALF